jgi:hypothetical protein
MEKTNRFNLGLVLAWIFVSIPLIWGITQTIIKSFALFQ